MSECRQHNFTAVSDCAPSKRCIETIPSLRLILTDQKFSHMVCQVRVHVPGRAAPFQILVRMTLNLLNSGLHPVHVKNEIHIQLVPLSSIPKVPHNNSWEQGHVPCITLFRNRPQLCIFFYHTCNLMQSSILCKINRKASIGLNGNANCTVLFKKPVKFWFSGPVVVTCPGPGQQLHRPWAECWLPGRCQWARCLPPHRPSAFCRAGTVPAATQAQR